MKIKQRRRNTEEKNRIVDGYLRGEEGQREYAGRVGVGLSTLGLWLRQRRSGRGARLVEVEMPLARSGSVHVYGVVMPSGLRVEIGRGFDAVEVKALLGMVRGEI